MILPYTPDLLLFTPDLLFRLREYEPDWEPTADFQLEQTAI